MIVGTFAVIRRPLRRFDASSVGSASASGSNADSSGDGRSQRGHRVGVDCTKCPCSLEDVLRDVTLGGHRRRKLLELVLIGERTVPEESEHFFITRLASEIFDGVSAIDQASFGTIDRTQFRFGNQYVL